MKERVTVLGRKVHTDHAYTTLNKWFKRTKPVGNNDSVESTDVRLCLKQPKEVGSSPPTV